MHVTDVTLNRPTPGQHKLKAFKSNYKNWHAVAALWRKVTLASMLGRRRFPLENPVTY